MRGADLAQRDLGGGSRLLLTCGGHGVKTAAHPNGRHATQRACWVCDWLERSYVRWLWNGLVSKAEAR